MCVPTVFGLIGESPGDLLLHEPLRQQVEHLSLALGEHRNTVAVRYLRRLPDEPPNAGDELSELDRLRKEVVGAEQQSCDPVDRVAPWTCAESGLPMPLTVIVQQALPVVLLSVTRAVPEPPGAPFTFSFEPLSAAVRTGWGSAPAGTVVSVPEVFPPVVDFFDPQPAAPSSTTAAARERTLRRIVPLR